LGDPLSLPTNLAIATFFVAIRAVIKDDNVFYAFSDSTAITISTELIK